MKLLNSINNKIFKIWSSIKGFVLQYDFKIFKKGEIFICSLTPHSVEQEDIKNKIYFCFNKLISEYYNEINEVSKKFDDSTFSVVIIISFTNQTGERISEHPLYNFNFSKIEDINLNYLYTILDSKIHKFLEKYNPTDIESIIIKIV